MRLLLDTHAFVWMLIDSPRLEPRLRQLVVDPSARVYASAVTCWEIATKVRLGKWPEAAVLLPDVADKAITSGMGMLALTARQAERGASFSLAHKDPFDRLLAAQALDQDMTLVNADSALAQFGCRLA